MSVDRTRRLMAAIIGALTAMVIALGAVVIDTAIDQAQIEVDRAEAKRTIDALTKRLYWAEEQLELLRR